MTVVIGLVWTCLSVGENSQINWPWGEGIKKGIAGFDLKEIFSESYFLVCFFYA